MVKIDNLYANRATKYRDQIVERILRCVLLEASRGCCRRPTII